MPTKSLASIEERLTAVTTNKEPPVAMLSDIAQPQAALSAKTPSQAALSDKAQSQAALSSKPQPKGLATIKTRLPEASQILPAFSVIVFVVYTWSLYRMFFQLPSWLGYLSLTNVLSLTAYVLMFALFESLFLLGILLVSGALLPKSWLRKDFTVQGSTLTGVAAFGAYLVQRKVGLLYKLSPEQLLLNILLSLLGLILTLAISAFIYSKLPRLQGWVRSLAERMTVFAYIYIPLSILSLVVVILRNLF